jgi:hypothetical protein
VALTVANALDPDAPETRPLTAFVSQQGARALGRVNLETRKILSHLPLGRIPGKVAAAGQDDVTYLYVVDGASGDLLEVELAKTLDPAAGDTLFDDQGAASDVELVGVKVTPGKTPSQLWTISYDESASGWVVRGDGLGAQKDVAETGRSFETVGGEISFTINQTGAAPPTHGDTFWFHTDNGVEAIDVGAGRAVDILATGSFLLVAMNEPTALAVLDVDSSEVTTVALPAGTIPASLTLAPGGEGVFVADRGNERAHGIDISSGVPASFTVASVALPTSAREIAITPDGRRLFALSNLANDVFVADLDLSVDPPAVVPLDLIGKTAGADPVPFRGGLRGLAAGPEVVTMRAGGAAYPVLVTSHSGGLFFLNGNSGCQDFDDDRGARMENFRFVDTGLISRPLFDLPQFFTNRCGGITQTESWRIVFNAALGAYEVIGSDSGTQVELAFEGEPYETDLGELRFVVEGSEESPTTDGDTFTLSVVDGVTPLGLGELPGDVAFFSLPDGPDGAEVAYALIASPGEDLLTQVHLGDRRAVATFR